VRAVEALKRAVEALKRAVLFDDFIKLCWSRRNLKPCIGKEQVKGRKGGWALSLVEERKREKIRPAVCAREIDIVACIEKKWPPLLYRPFYSISFAPLYLFRALSQPSCKINLGRKLTLLRLTRQCMSRCVKVELIHLAWHHETRISFVLARVRFSSIARSSFFVDHNRYTSGRITLQGVSDIVWHLQMGERTRWLVQKCRRNNVRKWTVERPDALKVLTIFGHSSSLEGTCQSLFSAALPVATS